MLREELIECAQELLEALDHSQIITALRLSLRGRGSEKLSSAKLIQCFQNYQLKRVEFGTAAKKLEQKLKLDRLVEPEFIATTITGDASIEIFDATRSTDFARQVLPYVVEILEQRDDHLEFERPLGEYETWPVRLPEPNSQISSTQRLVDFLMSVGTIYRACCRIRGLPDQPLRVLACDAGSDKSFNFIGMRVAGQDMRGLLKEFWERARLLRANSYRDRIELGASTITLIERLSAKNGHRLGDDSHLAELQGSLNDGIRQFIAVGAVAAEIDSLALRDLQVAID